MTIKHCKKCGAPFKASPAGATVNCPTHRGRTPKGSTQARMVTTCKCGKTVTHVNGNPVYINGHPATCPRAC